MGLEEKVKEALALVDLPTSEDFLGKVPDELSGGQRQRIGIARALILGADFIVADEPVSMLDASVKAGITSLMIDLKQKIGLTYVFITHEIGLAYYTCDRIAVMYLGKFVELGKAEEVIREPLHPYTQGIISCIPSVDHTVDRLTTIAGNVPLLIEPLQGCPFESRCTQKLSKCGRNFPPEIYVNEKHRVLCFLYESEQG